MTDRCGTKARSLCACVLSPTECCISPVSFPPLLLLLFVFSPFPLAASPPFPFPPSAIASERALEKYPPSFLDDQTTFFSCDARTKPPPPLWFSCLLLLLLRPQSASMKKRPGRLPPIPRTHTPTDARVRTHAVRRRRRPRLRPPRPPPPSAAARAVVIGQLFRGRRVEGGRGPLSPAPLQVQGGEGRRVWRWRKVIRTPPRERERLSLLLISPSLPPIRDRLTEEARTHAAPPSIPRTPPRPLAPPPVHRRSRSCFCCKVCRIVSIPVLLRSLSQ